jgi:putative GTP pyrophosphokinase
MGFFKQNIEKIEDTLVNLFQKQAEPGRKLMSYYRCALMAVETKFNILNEEFSLVYERNPIETIKTRIKTLDSTRKKLRKKGSRLTLNLSKKTLTMWRGFV